MEDVRRVREKIFQQNIWRIGNKYVILQVETL